MDKQLRSLLDWGSAALQKAGVLYPDKEATWVLLYLKGYSRVSDLGRIGKSLSKKDIEAYQSCIEKRSQGMPLEYIFKVAFFCDLRLTVTPSVLIPRQETEQLAHKICSFLQKSRDPIHEFRDVCCGSGCLGLAIKKRLPHIRVVLSDICPKALEVARENAENNHLEVEIVQGDLFDPFTGECDAFVCNPPYLAYTEVVVAGAEVRCQEPWLALVAPNHGLSFYQRIASQLKGFLRRGGVGWLEIGASQGDYVRQLFMQSGCSPVLLDKDLFGRDRFIQFFLE